MIGTSSACRIPIRPTARSPWHGACSLPLRSCSAGRNGARQALDYNGGTIELLARIIVRGSGEQLHDFARLRLFDPLAIGPTKWLALAATRPLLRLACV
jgi:hypothetical protein